MYVLSMIFSFDFFYGNGSEVYNFSGRNFIRKWNIRKCKTKLGSRGQKCMKILSEDVEKLEGTQISFFGFRFLKY